MAAEYLRPEAGGGAPSRGPTRAQRRTKGPEGLQPSFDARDRDRHRDIDLTLVGNICFLVACGSADPGPFFCGAGGAMPLGLLT